MTKICVFVGMTIGSYLGWYAGTLMGFEFFGDFVVSGVGSVAGVYLGWKLARRLES